MSRKIMLVIATAVMLSASLSVEAETKARQGFRVSVPSRMSISAPPVAAQATLQPDQAQVEIVPQPWSITANSRSGATVQFATEQSFHSLSDDSIRRDADLKVSIISQSSSAAWTVTQAQATTAHQIGQEAATVQVRSVRPGSAVLGLTVTFLQGDAVSTPQGDYMTTVVGTISAN